MNQGNNETCRPQDPVKTGEVELQLNRLSEGLNGLSEKISALEDRVVSVVTPEMPVGLDPAEGQPIGCITPLGQRIEDTVRRVWESKGRLQTLRDRIDL